MPCSPILVSRPQGSSSTKSAWAAASACLIDSSDASGRPRVTFSLTLTENRVGSSNAQATVVRSSASGRSRMSVPSSLMLPRRGVGEADDQAEQGRLARAGRADQGDGLAGGQFQADVAQDRATGAGIAEGDVLQCQAGGSGPSGLGGVPRLAECPPGSALRPRSAGRCLGTVRPGLDWAWGGGLNRREAFFLLKIFWF